MPCPTINNYRGDPKDYLKTGEGFALCEIRGNRFDQQDALAISLDNLTLFTNLSSKWRAQALKRTVATMQKDHGNHEYSGSTLCSVIAWSDCTKKTVNIDSVNLGDSSAYLVLLDSDNKLIQCERLTTPHSLDPKQNPTEYNRLRKKITYNKGGYRLDGDLMMGRSLGDLRHEDAGLSHEPEVKHDSQSLPEGGSAYMVLACDGLDNLSEQVIGKILARQLQLKNSIAHMAFNLVAEAFSAGSRDNISVVVFEIDATPRSALVLDGHGLYGEVIAENVAECFYPSLQTHIQEAISSEENLEPQRQEQIKDIQRGLERLSIEEKITLVKKILEPLVKNDLGDLGTYSQLDSLITDLETRYNISSFDKYLDNIHHYMSNTLGVFSRIDIQYLQCVYAYRSLSEDKKQTLISETLATATTHFAEKKRNFLALSEQVKTKILAIQTHINQQPINSSWWGFFASKNTGAKKRLSATIKRLSFELSDRSLQEDPYECQRTLNVKMTAALAAYEENLIKNNSLRHLTNYRKLQAELKPLDITPAPEPLGYDQGKRI